MLVHVDLWGLPRMLARASGRARAQGIVTQVTDVKPLLTVATYLDDASGFEVYQEITGAHWPSRGRLAAKAKLRSL